ncbi:hypothetical protein CF327_g576 [Tilletia walkeri]|uniref:Uncharacterized protein n=1 Tax=Tilletia indica TaxID=43049 RepID=A0A177TLT6_9BASI|nr:hypothetical protein CF327_g576 [Tilletia walkeri]KAE8231313.1 hypothetical protein CF326_g3679 [Tilletia indica]KAE8245077.1 hypothetical protein A4X13_0g6099 [Tilletia indica]
MIVLAMLKVAAISALMVQAIPLRSQPGGTSTQPTVVNAEKRVNLPLNWIVPTVATAGAIDHLISERPARLEQPRPESPPRNPWDAPSPPRPPQVGNIAPPNSPINSPPQSPPREPINLGSVSPGTPPSTPPPSPSHDSFMQVLEEDFAAHGQDFITHLRLPRNFADNTRPHPVRHHKSSCC